MLPVIFTEADVVIKQLFRKAGGNNTSTFSSGALFFFFVPYITMATVVYNIVAPADLFVPSSLAGAAFGRLCGHLLHKLDHTSGTFEKILAKSAHFSRVSEGNVLFSCHPRRRRACHSRPL
jgi:hypothetical protein